MFAAWSVAGQYRGFESRPQRVSGLEKRDDDLIFGQHCHYLLYALTRRIEQNRRWRAARARCVRSKAQPLHIQARRLCVSTGSYNKICRTPCAARWLSKIIASTEPSHLISTQKSSSTRQNRSHHAAFSFSVSSPSSSIADKR